MNAPSGVRRISLRTCVAHRRPTVRRESHHLVLVFVHGEAEVRGEGGVQHAERVRELDLALKRDVGGTVRAPLAVADRERRPFAHAVRGQDGGAAGRRREERRRRVRGVVVREQDLAPRQRRDTTR